MVACSRGNVPYIVHPTSVVMEVEQRQPTLEEELEIEDSSMQTVAAIVATF